MLGQKVPSSSLWIILKCWQVRCTWKGHGKNEEIVWQEPHEIKQKQMLCCIWDGQHHAAVPFGHYWGESFAGADMEVLVKNELIMTQKCAIAVKRAMCILGCMNASVDSRFKEVVLPLYSAVLGMHMEYPKEEISWCTGVSSAEVSQDRLGDGAEKVTAEAKRSELVDVLSLMNQRGTLLLSSST